MTSPLKDSPDDSPDDSMAQLPDRLRDRFITLWFGAHDDPTLHVMSAAFVLGCSAHLLIADAWQITWLPANLFIVCGILLLLWRRCAIGFAITLPGLLWPLLALRDQLTQSVLLALFAASMTLGMLSLGTLRWRHAQRIWRGIVTSTYALAALHKLNTDFLDPFTSCANYGWREIFDTWMLPQVWAQPAPWLANALPLMVIATEALIAMLYLVRRRRIAWALSLGFHLPLTMTMAPAFAFVMLVGHAAWCEPEDLAHIKTLWHTHRPRLIVALVVGVAGALLSILGAYHVPEGSVMVREVILWTLFTLSLTWTSLSAWCVSTRTHIKGMHPVTLLFLGFFWVNGLSPYSGKQVQHAGAMLSNLRVDKGCWNSLVFPERVRLTDDYIRVDTAHFEAPGVDPTYEELMRSHLWSPPQLRQMQRNWCSPARRPFMLRGTWRGRPFVIDDLCAIGPDELPFEGAGFLGVEIFPNAIRFQKNLLRECPQRCIH